MKKYIFTFILCLIPISAIGLLLYCLETYNNVVHNESGLLVCAYAVMAFVLSSVISLCNRKSIKRLAVIWIISTAILVFVFYTGAKIPFCVVCDRVTADELGFLIYWIQPEGH